MAEKRLWPILLSVSELSRALGCDRKTIYVWHRQGLPIFKLGTKRKIFTADLVTFLRAQLKQVEPNK